MALIYGVPFPQTLHYVVSRYLVICISFENKIEYSIILVPMERMIRNGRRQRLPILEVVSSVVEWVAI